jgi:hypothetical protein
MAGATLAEIRAGLEVRLATIAGVQTSAYMLDSPMPPTLQVMGPDEVSYDLAMARGLDLWRLIVQGFVGSPMDQGAQVNLDEWLAPAGAKSVKAAIEADGTLGGKIQGLHVEKASGYRLYQLENRGSVLGAEWTIQIYNRGD